MFKITTMASLLLVGSSAHALDAQDRIGFKYLGDRWPSAESRTNLGMGLALGWGVGAARLVFSADYVPIGLGEPQGMVRASYFDFDVGVLFYPADWVFVGAGLGAILTTISVPDSVPPGGYPTRGQRHGWTTPFRVGLEIPARGFLGADDVSVEVQYWRRLPVQNQAGVVKSDRLVLASHWWGAL